MTKNNSKRFLTEQPRLKRWRFNQRLFSFIPRVSPVGFFFSRVLLFIPLFLLLAGAATAFAEELPGLKAMVSSETTEKPFGERKTLHGHIGGISQQGFALVYAKDEATHSEKEIWFPFNPGLRLSGYETTVDIMEGDEAVAVYEEDAQANKRVLREVNFVSRKQETNKPEEAEKTESGSPAEAVR